MGSEFELSFRRSGYPLLKTHNSKRLRSLSPVFRLVLFAAIDPRFHADLSVCRVRFGKAVVDVGLQGMERKPALLVPRGPRDLGAVQTARASDLDPLGAQAEGGLDPLLHRAPEGHAPLELEGDRFRDELGVRLGTLD